MGRFDNPRSEGRTRALRKTVVFLILIGVILILLGLNGRDPLESARPPAETFTARIGRIATMPVRGIENLASGFRDHFDTVEENRKLREENARLRSIVVEDAAVTEQVDYIKNLFGADIRTGVPEERLAARAISEINGPFVYSALIDAGQNKGVTEGSPVLTIHGLYGRVTRIGTGSARVLLLKDLNSRIAVMSPRSRARAILTGNNSDLPTLEFRGDGDWQVGDSVVSSGDDGVLPRGLPIGEVVGLEGGVLAVRLFSDRETVDWVTVRPFEPVLPPEENPIATSADQTIDQTGESEQP